MAKEIFGKTKIAFIFLTLSLTLSFLSVLILASPGVPHWFSGDVTVNNAPASDGLAITVKISDSVVAINYTKDGKYGADGYFYI